MDFRDSNVQARLDDSLSLFLLLPANPDVDLPALSLALCLGSAAVLPVMIIMN